MTIQPKPGESLAADEIKILEKEILAAFWEFCKEHKIRMWLAYGTLLGAVRHGDMIPWDDDIDVVIPSSDLKKMLAILREQGSMINHHIKVVCPATDAGSYTIFPKIVDIRTQSEENALRSDIDATTGVWIDIFVLYGSDPLFLRERAVQLLHHFFYTMARLVTFENFPGASQLGKGLHRLFRPLARLMGHTFWNKAAFWVSTNLFRSFSCGDYVYVEANTSLKFPRRIFKGARMEFFGQNKYPIPVGYDEYLKIRYGSDYMEPPAEKDRYSHQMDARWR
ncbi:MAG: LicD family protein [Arcanobacterium sp.]|nr:LicD family protein [Arcanobacterium sp.]